MNTLLERTDFSVYDIAELWLTWYPADVFSESHIAGRISVLMADVLEKRKTSNTKELGATPNGEIMPCCAATLSHVAKDSAVKFCPYCGRPLGTA